MTLSNFGHLFLGALFSGTALGLTIYYHKKTFLLSLPTLVIVNISMFLVWIFGDIVAYNQNIWQLSENAILGPRILHMPIEDIILTILPVTTLSLVTIIFAKAYKRNLRFRDLFFKKE